MDWKNHGISLSGAEASKETRYTYDMEGDRVGVQTADGPRRIAFNEVNELQSESDGEQTLVKGIVDEAAVVKVSGAFARMLTDTQFGAETDTQPGNAVGRSD